MGCEMLYVLDQRLRAQAIAPAKGRKVLAEVTLALLSPSALDRTWAPQAPQPMKAFRALLEKVAHSSVMRLNSLSMDKLFDLVTMGCKVQLAARAPSPGHVIAASLHHLLGLRAILTGLTNQQAPSGQQSQPPPVDAAVTSAVAALDATAHRLMAHLTALSGAELASLHATLSAFFKDRRVKVSVLLQDGLQQPDGTIPPDTAAQQRLVAYYHHHHHRQTSNALSGSDVAEGAGSASGIFGAGDSRHASGSAQSDSGQAMQEDTAVLLAVQRAAAKAWVDEHYADCWVECALPVIAAGGSERRRGEAADRASAAAAATTAKADPSGAPAYTESAFVKLSVQQLLFHPQLGTRLGENMYGRTRPSYQSSSSSSSSASSTTGTASSTAATTSESAGGTDSGKATSTADSNDLSAASTSASSSSSNRRANIDFLSSFIGGSAATTTTARQPAPVHMQLGDGVDKAGSGASKNNNDGAAAALELDSLGDCGLTLDIDLASNNAKKGNQLASLCLETEGNCNNEAADGREDDLLAMMDALGSS